MLFIGAPRVLGSFYCVLAGLALTLLLMVRILGEEKMLARDLEGYPYYMQNVRNRLFSFSLVAVKKSRDLVRVILLDLLQRELLMPSGAS